MFYVPIPATGSDAQSGIAPSNAYTNAVAAGNAKSDALTVNGVALPALSGSGNSSTANGVTLSAATGTLINGGGKSETIQADGATARLLSGMIFNDGAADNSEQYAVLDPAALVAGKTYDLRVYVCNASGENRQVNLTFAGDGKPAVSTDFFNEDDATTSAGGFDNPNQAYYINYRFTWDGVSTPGFTATQKFGSTPFCLYALTNHEVGANADARPAGAVAVEAPDPIRAAPRSSRTDFADTDDDIGVASDVFYNADSLRDNGRWVSVGDYGRCWQPQGVDEDWQPYTRGRWVYSQDEGWVWDSDEDFGWATYHYGRWFRDEDTGWYWVPGRRWAPAWVSWRHGHGYLGWAPLPPLALAAAGIGIGVWADHRWGIGPRAYNFVNARDFGARSMAKVILPRAQNAAIMTNTNNVTNIVSGKRGVFNGGPSFQAVNNALVRTGAQPIPMVRVARSTGTAPVNAGTRATQLAAGILPITAPSVPKTKKPTALPPVAATIKSPKIDRGWNGLTDPTRAAALKAKIASETPGNAAKTAPAVLPGAIASSPTTAATKGSGVLKPFRPGKSSESALVKPGQPATPAGAAVIKPGQPVRTTGGNPPKPGQPVTQVTPVTPGTPATATTPTATGMKKRSDKTKPPTIPVPQPGRPANAVVAAPAQPNQPPKPTPAPVIKPGQRVKPAAVTPPAPGTAAVQPATAPAPTPDPRRNKKRTPQPATTAVTPTAPTTVPVKPATVPVTPPAPTPAPSRPKKNIAPPATPAPVPVRPAAPPAPVAKPTPRPTPRPAPPVSLPPKPAPAAPVARPNPRPAPPAPVPSKPAPSAAPQNRGGKPTPTPAPGTNG